MQSKKTCKMCNNCNKQLKASELVKLTKTDKLHEIDNFQVNIINKTNTKKVIYICDKCFDGTNFIEVTNEIINEINSDDNFNLQICVSAKKIFLQKSEWKKYSKLKNNSIEKTKRRKQLMNKLSLYKLNYEKCLKTQVCESYLNGGNIDIDTVIQQLYVKQSEEDDRLCELLEKLKSLDLEYDCKIPSYKKYILKGGDINAIVESAELEKDLIKDTNYLSLYNQTDSDTAKEIVIGKVEKKTKRLEKYIAKKNTLKFD